MKLFWKVKKKIETPAEHKLEEIQNILFPRMQLDQKMDNDGTIVKYHIDYSADSNLDAALMDLVEGYNDKATQETINDVVKRLHKIRKLMEAYAEIDKDAKYIIVENFKDDLDAQESVF